MLLEPAERRKRAGAAAVPARAAGTPRPLPAR